METPIFMGWTIIPADVVARAWTDLRFKRDFLRWPTQTLTENGIPIPTEIQFCVMENMPDTRYLVLPYRSPHTYRWNPEKVEKVLRKETGNDNSLEFWLPVGVMMEAYYNPEFRKRLLIDTTSVLNEMGYDTAGHKYITVENTPDTFHLVLPVNKWNSFSLSPEELEDLLVQEFSAEMLLH